MGKAVLLMKFNKWDLRVRLEDEYLTARTPYILQPQHVADAAA